MTVNIRGYHYHYQWLTPYDKTKPTLLYLHGFTGTGVTFSEAAHYIKSHNSLVIDLPGHGLTDYDLPETRYTFEESCQDIAALLTHLNLDTVDLLGYSMGGRLALSFALNHPDRVNRLLLESSSPGLKTTEEREARQKKDNQLANRIETEGVVAFVNYWESLPLFDSQRSLAPSIQQTIREQRLSQYPKGLAQSLRRAGTGSQSSNWANLSSLDIPTLYAVGSLDEKFKGIGKEMALLAPNMTYTLIDKAGHCPHIEQPALFYKAVTDFLKEEQDESY